MSYSVLVQRIQDTTQNNDPVFLANIDNFITMAERQIHNEANLPSSRKNAVGTTAIGSRSVLLPSDYISLSTVDITTASGVFALLPKSAPFLNEMYPNSAIVAQPKFYALYDSGTLQFAPTPDAIYPVGFHYYAMPTTIVSSGNTWLDTNFPQTLLYASVLHAYVFMKGAADVMTYYKTAYDTSLTEMKTVLSTLNLKDYR